MRGSDAVFVAACREAGLEVGVGSGLLLLAVRKVFDAGARHLAWRHLSELWAEHEALDAGLCISPEEEADYSDMLSIRSHMDEIRARYLK